VFTLDAYAWALYVNGRYQEARSEIETALKVGIRDARIFRHAGDIASKCGDQAAAQKYQQEAAGLAKGKQDQANVGPYSPNQLALTK
jgi:tetratricopeptide (TPR) repeat protein